MKQKSTGVLSTENPQKIKAEVSKRRNLPWRIKFRMLKILVVSLLFFFVFFSPKSCSRVSCTSYKPLRVLNVMYLCVLFSAALVLWLNVWLQSICLPAWAVAAELAWDNFLFLLLKRMHEIVIVCIWWHNQNRHLNPKKTSLWSWSHLYLSLSFSKEPWLNTKQKCAQS